VGGFLSETVSPPCTVGKAQGPGSPASWESILSPGLDGILGFAYSFKTGDACEDLLLVIDC
jgi:hypothetical protein